MPATINCRAFGKYFSEHRDEFENIARGAIGDQAAAKILVRAREIAWDDHWQQMPAEEKVGWKALLSDHLPVQSLTAEPLQGDEKGEAVESVGVSAPSHAHGPESSGAEGGVVGIEEEELQEVGAAFVKCISRWRC